MKKAILATLIATSISNTALANELAKLKFINEAPTPTFAAIPAKTDSVLSVDPLTTDISQQVFVDNNIYEIALLTPEEMAETEGAAWPVLVALAWINAGVWGNHGISYYHTGQPASVESTALAAATSAIPAVRTLYGTRLAGSAAATTYTNAHGHLMNGIQVGIGAAASDIEHRPRKSRSFFWGRRR